MENFSSVCFALRLPLLIMLFNCSCATIINSATDKQALVSFKIHIKSDPDAILATSWSNNDTSISVCSWIGVSCDIKHRRVTALNLSGYDLAGTVAPHLGNLTFLRYLDISSNNFTGFLPPELANLRRLKVMNAGVNSLTGEIPTWLGSLPQLEELHLHNNSFWGRIPPSLFNNSSKLQLLRMSVNLLSGNIPKEIGSSSSLKTIQLSYNSLSGNIPEEIGNISSLEALYLGKNQLSGSIFNLSSSSIRAIQISANMLTGWLPSDMCSDTNMPNLNTLALSANQLSGEIPPNIWKCKHLEVVDLSYNNFSGSIPRGIGNMSMLRELYLMFNDFTGELPKEIGTLPSLQLFTVFNNSLSGSIPSSIFNISCLKRLEFSLNEFSGSLPSDMGYSLFNLESLLLSSNRLNGPIPTSITNASKLTILDMSANSLNAFVPDFGNLGLLQRLYIWGNNLRGAESPTQELRFLSSLTNCRYLERLELADNPLNGILPASIGNFSTSLLYFTVENTNIGGVIPSKIGNLSSLLYLYLGGNQLGGQIPPTIGNLKQLQKLYIGGNQLVGSITNDLCRLNNLGELGLSGNMLVGSIPECLGDVKSLRHVYLASNQLNSNIPPNLWTLRDLMSLNLSSNYLSGHLSLQLANLKAINTLHLSFNQFSGDIPTTIGDCLSLETLNLSSNKFGGSIPQSLGNIRSLVTLDLSNNSISGLLPKTLAKLPFLWDFNVSYNKLEGEIPMEGCFLNFTAHSFVHNIALCGPIRFQVPPCSKNHGGSRVKKSFVHLIKYILPPALICVVILVIIIFMLTKRRQNQKKKVVLPPSTNILQGIEWRRISYIDLQRGTSSFNEANLLGKGSFGSVFQAILSDGLIVAVKVFDLQSERASKSFDTESELLSTIRHRNILHVIGCCSNMEFKALILEYMPNGSLEKWLYSDSSFLDLEQRLKIAIDVALALEYLHHGYTFSIVHCDIKPSNVLLDEDMTARVGDFGISKLFDNGEDVIHTKTLATIGYAAPEYGSEGKVSTSGDVYSYGIMLLKLFTNKKPTDNMFNEEMSLKEWVNEALQNNAISEVADSRLLAREDRHFLAKEQCVSSLFYLAMKCAAISPIERMNMVEAVAALQKIKATFVASKHNKASMISITR